LTSFQPSSSDAKEEPNNENLKPALNLGPFYLKKGNNFSLPTSMIRKHQKGEGEMFSNPVDRFFFLVHKISVKIVKKGVGGGGGDIGLSDIYRVSVFHNLWQALYIS
jgi:hypothetical protein